MEIDKQKDRLILWCSPLEFEIVKSFLKIPERVSNDRIWDQGYDNLLIKNFIDGPFIVALDR